MSLISPCKPHEKDPFIKRFLSNQHKNYEGINTTQEKENVEKNPANMYSTMKNAFINPHQNSPCQKWDKFYQR